MSDVFHCEILLPSREVASLDVSEVVLPAHDGERGILAHHENFIGLLGTGVLRLRHEGTDYWVAVSKGTYLVRDGRLTVLAETAESSDEIDAAKAEQELRRIEQLLSVASHHAPEFPALKLEYERERARVEAVKRAGH